MLLEGMLSQQNEYVILQIRGSKMSKSLQLEGMHVKLVEKQRGRLYQKAWLFLFSSLSLKSGVRLASISIVVVFTSSVSLVMFHCRLHHHHLLHSPSFAFVPPPTPAKSLFMQFYLSIDSLWVKTAVISWQINH